ncbi:hypothetical protein G7Z17_g7551 [Cylindrodendrum hubeiense]|uniref:Uncharacterized protein n=1 Tax=Cylindrodendrum hubeiense TaxID=595255 RepID=A0A9P5L9U3_9HYPO|nr:hypothetical protein G7Z17_g7551 [Cylindrodendrum hubeiense]
MSQINTPPLKNLWEQAQSKPKWAATKFWSYVFKQNVFRSRHWVVASYQPPTEDDSELRRLDVVVTNIDDNGSSTTLLFMQAKGANIALDRIDDVEYQAFTACCAHLYNTGRPAVWAMTCVGSKTRLWAYKLNDDYMTPFWPLEDELSTRSKYAEYSTQGQEILRKLNFIKDNPTPDSDVFQTPPSTRPAFASLPPGWHDNEVALIPPPPKPSQVYSGPGSSSSVQKPPNDAPGSRFQLESTNQGLIVDNGALEADVDKYEDNRGM